MSLSDRILRRLHSWAQAVDRRLGQEVIREKEEPAPPVERHTCYHCHERFEGPGFLVGNRRYCTEVCSPPFLRGNGNYRLAGDPRG